MEIIVIGAGILVLFLAVVGIRDDAYGRNARRVLEILVKRSRRW